MISRVFVRISTVNNNNGGHSDAAWVLGSERARDRDQDHGLRDRDVCPDVLDKTETFPVRDRDETLGMSRDGLEIFETHKLSAKCL